MIGLAAVSLQQLPAHRGSGQNSFVFWEILQCLREVAAYLGCRRDADLVGQARGHVRLMDDGRDLEMLCRQNHRNGYKTAL